MKTLAKLFRWLFPTQPCHNCADCRDAVDPKPASAPKPRQTDAPLTVVEKLDALPLQVLRELTQTELAELVGVSQSGVSVYRRTRGIVGAKSTRKQ